MSGHQAMIHIGFNHGTLYRVMDKYSPENIDIFADCSTDLLEVSCMRINEVSQLAKIVPLVERFHRKTIHLPTDIRYADDEATRSLLTNICSFYGTIGAELAVVHPDLIDDVRVFDDFPVAWAIENMDHRKTCFRNAEDLQAFFTENDSWKMVLDVNHCFVNDPTMRLAEDLINRFRPRMREIHLSGFVSLHEPLFETRQENILQACESLDLPIVIESTFDHPGQVQKEFTYVSHFFRAKMLTE